MSNDVKSDLEENEPEFCKAMEEIWQVVEPDDE